MNIKNSLQAQNILRRTSLQRPHIFQSKDLIFRVEVLSKGKSSGKNKNYLNIRYTDGSVGGVFIDKHEWRIIKRGASDEASEKQ